MAIVEREAPDAGRETARNLMAQWAILTAGGGILKEHGEPAVQAGVNRLADRLKARADDLYDHRQVTGETMECVFTPSGHVLVDVGATAGLGASLGFCDVAGPDWRPDVEARLAANGFRRIGDWRVDEEGVSRAPVERV